MWKDKPWKLAGVMGSWAVLWWVGFGLVRWVGGGEVSRRLANSAYVVWVGAFNVGFLSCYQLVGLVARRWVAQGARWEVPEAPAIFEAINRNGLLVFLVVSASRFTVSVPRLPRLTLDLSLLAGQPADGAGEPVNGEHLRARRQGHPRARRLPRRRGRGRVGAQEQAAEDLACSPRVGCHYYSLEPMSLLPTRGQSPAGTSGF